MAVGIVRHVDEALAAQVHMRRHAQQMHVLGSGPGRSLDVVGGPGGILRPQPAIPRVMARWRGRLLGEDHADRRTVETHLADRRVVNLEDQVRSGRNLLGDARGIDRGHVARRIGDEQVLVSGHACLQFSCCDHRYKCRYGEQRRDRRARFGGLDIEVLGVSGRQPEVLDRDGSLGLDLERSRASRRRGPECRSTSPAGISAARASERSPGGVLARSRRSTAQRSRADQAAVVGEMAKARVGVPRGHPVIGDDLGDRRRPPVGLLVGQERERRNLALPMARRAAGMKDRRDMLGIGHDLAVLREPVPATLVLDADRTRPSGARGGTATVARLGRALRSIGQPTTCVISVATFRPSSTASIASVR